jgi:hypothetical protein
MRNRTYLHPIDTAIPIETVRNIQAKITPNIVTILHELTLSNINA